MTPKVKTSEKATQQNELGMNFDAEGKFKSINFNILVKYFISKLKIVIDDSDDYYYYSTKRKVWIKTDISTICTKIRHLVHKKLPDIWQSRYDHEVKNVLFHNVIN